MQQDVLLSEMSILQSLAEMTKVVCVPRFTSSALKISNLYYVYYRFSALAINFGVQPKTF